MPSRFNPKSKRQTQPASSTAPEPQTNTTIHQQSTVVEKKSSTLQHKRVKPTPDGSNPADDTPIDDVISSARWGETASQWLVPGETYDISGVHRNHSGQNAYCSFWGYVFIRTESVKRLRDGVETCHYRYVFKYPGGQTLNVYDDDIHEYTSFRKASASSFKPHEDYEAFKLWETKHPRLSLLNADKDWEDDVVETVERPELEPEAPGQTEQPSPKRKFKRRF